ncbi:MAG: glycosyl hydrolases family 18-domain-containing protein [Benniella sp.]|nr:MAG: glycosyl hydrolases family 18-domain-containing protein [Benniella sp.]
MKFSFLALAATAVAVASAAPLEKRAAKPNVVVGYWVPWGGVPVSAVDMTKYTHINYGFGVTAKRNPKVTDIFFDRYYDGNNIKALVKRGNEYGVPILMSIGGWTGSQTLSTIAADAGLRKTFINNALVFVRNNTLPDYADTPDGWNMHGLDIDWEYPNRAAAACNTYGPADTANYLILLKELRAQLDLEFPNDRKLLTAAVRVQPFDGPDGKPLADVSAFAQYYDWISIMAYDIMGGWSANTGPNAPLHNGPSPKADPYSVSQSIDAWVNAKFPIEKLVLGTAFYGRSVITTVDMNTQSPVTMYVNKTSTVPKGGPSDSNEINFFCNEGSNYSGMWKWKEIRGNILTSSPTTPASGWSRYWDDQTQTPFLFRAADKTFISYDDIQSLGLKVNYAKSRGVKGVMLWDISYDYNGELINVLQGIHCTTNCPVIPTTTRPPVTTTTNPPVSGSTTVPLPTTTVGTGACSGVAAWNSATVYAAPGQKVTYNNRLYTNKWWTQGETPGVSADGVWKDNGAC